VHGQRTEVERNFVDFRILDQGRTPDIVARQA
jgi:hypothetical protein